MIYKTIVSSLGCFAVARRMSSGSKFKVFVTRSDFPDVGIDLLKQQCDVTLWDRSKPRAQLLKELSDTKAQALFVCIFDKIDKEVIAACGPSLKVIGTYSVGYDHIDIKECKKRGIRIGYTPNAVTDSTAEFTVALLLTVARRIIECRDAERTGKFKAWAPQYLLGPGLTDSIIGIVGFGRIGQSVAREIKSFKPRKILYCDISEKPEAKQTGAIKVSFDELISESDFISCNLPLTPDTKEIFNRQAFAKMKPLSVFVNTGRGGVVDQEALTEVLQKKKIFGAGLDVTIPEPLPVGHPLLELENCIVVPHMATSTIQTRNIMCEITANNILAALNGTKMIDELKL